MKFVLSVNNGRPTNRCGCWLGAMLPLAGGPPGGPVQVIAAGLPPSAGHHPLPVSAPHINPAFVSASSAAALPPPGGAVGIFDIVFS